MCSGVLWLHNINVAWDCHMTCQTLIWAATNRRSWSFTICIKWCDWQKEPQSDRLARSGMSTAMVSKETRNATCCKTRWENKKNTVARDKMINGQAQRSMFFGSFWWFRFTRSIVQLDEAWQSSFGSSFKLLHALLTIFDVALSWIIWCTFDYIFIC